MFDRIDPAVRKRARIPLIFLASYLVCVVLFLLGSAPLIAAILVAIPFTMVLGVVVTIIYNVVVYVLTGRAPILDSV